MDTNNFIGDGNSLGIEVGTYFIYNKRDYMGKWAGYQIALKVSYQYCIPIDLPYSTLMLAAYHCNKLNNKE